ncbi:MAG: hypothetical protein KDJ99_24980, partial [Candidatus Competibacteraceae bacterium]|nr:hypothetical protein [Candidatus Competibacteraceae bacterium]
MADQSHAWLLAPLGMRPVIVAQHAVQQYLTDFHLLAVPFTPAHCSTAIIWQERIVPVLNLGGLAGESYRSGFKLAVLAYQQEPLTPLHYVALAVAEAPERISVADDDVCDPPAEDVELWAILAQTWVKRDNLPTPIISIAKLDSIEFCRYVERVFAALSPAVQATWQQAAATTAVASPSRFSAPARDANSGAVMAAIGSSAAIVQSTIAKPVEPDLGLVSTESRLAQTASKSTSIEDAGAADLDDDEDINSWDDDELDDLDEDGDLEDDDDLD